VTERPADGSGRPAPERLESERLRLRRPAAEDADVIFERYAGDPEVTRYLGWPRHRSVDDTRAFLAFSDSDWERWGAGPYLILSRSDGGLLGGTGLALESRDRAATGYVLARDAWGRGYATEALRAVVGVAGSIGLRSLYALCHPEHAVSIRVLEKCGFALESRVAGGYELPNLAPGEPCDVLRWTLAVGSER
jgi:RimJ/RimL family protein N-acetyltransferase